MLSTVTAFADWVTVSTYNTTPYFQTFSSKGVWTGIGTPAHYVNETGAVAYCLQTNYNSPNNSGFSTVSGWNYYDATTIYGLQAILENGYPNGDGGYPQDQATYATANAIRFWLAERGCEGVPAWMNQSLYSQFFRGAYGYEGLFDWCISLLNCARSQSVMQHTVSFTPISIVDMGDYYEGTTTVRLVNCIGGYTLDQSGLPTGTEISGYTANDGDVLTIRIPKDYDSSTFTLTATGIDNMTDASLIFFNPDNWGEQRMLAYTYNIEQNVATGAVSMTTPEGPQNAGLTIRKTDADTGAVMPGVTFALYNSSGEFMCNGTTDQDGYVYFTDLPLGDYFYEEINTLDGYVLDNTRYSVALTQSGHNVDVSVVNEHFKAHLAIVKQDRDSRTPLPGAGFRLYNDSGELVGEGVTDDSGRILFAGLAKGSYSYQEYAAPAGYVLDDTMYPVEVAEHGKTVTVYADNARRSGTLVVSKKDATGEALLGAEYLLEYSVDSGGSWQPVHTATVNADTGGCTSAGLNDGRLTVDSSGSAVFTGLRADGGILYRLTETKAPDGHSLLAGVVYQGKLPVKVDAGAELEDCEIINDSSYCYTVYVTAVDCETYRLPSTGGSGFAYIPILLPTLCVGFYFIKIKESANKKSSPQTRKLSQNM